MTHILEPDARATSAIRKAAHDILDRGYAVVKLSELDTGNLHTAIGTAVDFFQLPLEDKQAHGSTDHNYGYRPFGIEYSISPDRPDMNECFTLWSSRLDLIPNAADVIDVTDAILCRTSTRTVIWSPSCTPPAQASRSTRTASRATRSSPCCRRATRS